MNYANRRIPLSKTIKNRSSHIYKSIIYTNNFKRAGCPLILNRMNAFLNKTLNTKTLHNDRKHPQRRIVHIFCPQFANRSEA